VLNYNLFVWLESQKLASNMNEGGRKKINTKVIGDFLELFFIVIFHPQRERERERERIQGWLGGLTGLLAYQNSNILQLLTWSIMIGVISLSHGSTTNIIFIMH
jgi:hypothetical protein